MLAINVDQLSSGRFTEHPQKPNREGKKFSAPVRRRVFAIAAYDEEACGAARAPACARRRRPWPSVSAVIPHRGREATVGRALRADRAARTDGLEDAAYPYRASDERRAPQDAVSGRTPVATTPPPALPEDDAVTQVQRPDGAPAQGEAEKGSTRMVQPITHSSWTVGIG